MIRTVIIEDEEANRMFLKTILKDYIKNVEIVGEATSVSDAVALIQNSKPDIILLDIEIDGGTGFDVLSQIDTKESLVVFTTGYDQHAIQAIKNNAFDYLLKPILVKEMQTVFDKAKIVLTEMKLLRELQTQESISENSEKILLKDANLQKVVLIKDIIMIKADGSYSMFYFVDGSEFLISKTLKQIETEFPGIFFRTHRSYLINLDYAEKWEVVRGGNLTLKNSIIVPISYRKKSDFLLAIRNKLDKNNQS